MVDDGAGWRAQVPGGIGPDDAKRQAQQIAGCGAGSGEVGAGPGMLHQGAAHHGKAEGRMQNEEKLSVMRGAGAVVCGPWSLPPSSPSGEHSQPGAAPDQG